MAELRISFDEVKEKAQSIRTRNNAMYEELNQMKANINLLDGSWISDGSEEIRTRFNQFANRFETERERIEEYARFLDLAVESYETLESSITSNASSMQY
jgi:uncharacterized protein YukE